MTKEIHKGTNLKAYKSYIVLRGFEIKNSLSDYCWKWAIFTTGGLWGNSEPVVAFEWNFASSSSKNLPMIEVSLCLIGRDETKLSPKICFHLDMDGQYLSEILFCISEIGGHVQL